MALTNARDILNKKILGKNEDGSKGPIIEMGKTSLLTVTANNVADYEIEFNNSMPDVDYNVSLTINNLAWGGQGINSQYNCYYSVVSKSKSKFTIRIISFQNPWNVSFDWIAIHND